MSVTYKFFALLGRLNLIKRWGLMRNTTTENVMEHSWQVATIAHGLAVIGKDLFGRDWQPETMATAALYHDVSEIITGDLPTPIKYHSTTISKAYKAIEAEAEAELLNQLPSSLRQSFTPFLIQSNLPDDVRFVIKSADLISAYLKCQFELDAGNKEFKDAIREIEAKLRNLNSKEVDYFMAHFVTSYQLTLDELLKQHTP
jgi:5'-deoxynucleotidase